TCFGVAVGKPLSTDQKIMAAADGRRTFDPIHMMPDGDMKMVLSDMLLTPRQYRMMHFRGDPNRRSKRKAVKEVVIDTDGEPFITRWPEGQVFYDFDDDSMF
ncbi:hypothetical protein BaRGS_00034253, partial [Batillaria attramentaria]